MSIILGKNIIIYETKNGVKTAIAGAKSCKIVTTTDTIETSFPTTENTATGSWKNYISQRKGWTITMDHLVQSVKGTLLRNGGTYTLTCGIRDDENDQVAGVAICVECEVSGACGAIANGTFKFLGTGPLDEVESTST